VTSEKKHFSHWFSETKKIADWSYRVYTRLENLEKSGNFGWTGKVREKSGKNSSGLEKRVTGYFSGGRLVKTQNFLGGCAPEPLLNNCFLVVDLLELHRV